MIKYAKVIDAETGLCEVATGINASFYESIGMSETDVAQSDIDSNWYLSEKCPMKTDEEKLAEGKQVKHKENLEKAYAAEENGIINYKNVCFETTSTNLSKLASHLALIRAGIITNVQWLSKDDVKISLNEADIIELSRLITDYTANIWNTTYLNFKTQIDNISTVTELESFTILY